MYIIFFVSLLFLFSYSQVHRRLNYNFSYCIFQSNCARTNFILYPDSVYNLLLPPLQLLLMKNKNFIYPRCVAQSSKHCGRVPMQRRARTIGVARGMNSGRSCVALRKTYYRSGVPDFHRSGSACGRAFYSIKQNNIGNLRVFSYNKYLIL